MLTGTNKILPDILQDTKQSLKRLWDTFGPIFNPVRANKKNPINKIIQNNKVITDYKDNSNAFNDYFVNVANKSTEIMPKSNNFKKISWQQ